MSDMLRLLIARYLLEVESLCSYLRECMPLLRERAQSDPLFRLTVDRLDGTLTRVEALTGGLDAAKQAPPAEPEATPARDPATSESSCVCGCGASLVPECMGGMPLYRMEGDLRVYKAKCLSCGWTGEVRRRGQFEAPMEHPCNKAGAVDAARQIVGELPRLANQFVLLRHPGTRDGRWRLRGDWPNAEQAHARFRMIDVRQGGAVVIDVSQLAIPEADPLAAITRSSFAPMLRTRW